LGDKKDSKTKKERNLLKEIAKKTEGYTGADLDALARERLWKLVEKT
jgi:SpoVK/Ycf46/Vps4 family AAA+-type ATPase